MIYERFIYFKVIHFNMGFVEIKRKGFRCERCEHEWIPNDIKIEPTVCPKCKSPYWKNKKLVFGNLNTA